MSVKYLAGPGDFVKEPRWLGLRVKKVLRTSVGGIGRGIIVQCQGLSS